MCLAGRRIFLPDLTDVKPSLPIHRRPRQRINEHDTMKQILMLSFILTQRTPTCRALSKTPPSHLRRIQVDLRPQLSHPIVAYERENLQDEELLERALGAQTNGDASNNSGKSFHDTLGLHAWPSGFVAARQTLDMIANNGKGGTISKVLELACGTGIPSLAAYHAGCDVIATDLDVRLLSHSFAEQSTSFGNTYQCLELDLLDRIACEEILNTRPDLVIAADCFYDATLAKAVGEIMGIAANRYQCSILAADPGRLEGNGRRLFLDGFFGQLNAMQQEDDGGFEEVEMPQELLRASGASLDWCGVAETKVGIFTWPR